jgi:hypothetical protein
MTNTLIVAPVARVSSLGDINAIVAVTIRERIITAFEAALRGLLVKNGFHTDSGLKVFRCRKSVLPDDLPCIIVWPGIEVANEYKYSSHYCSMKMGIETMALFGSEHPSVVAERLLGDLLQLVFGRTVTPLADVVLYESGGTDNYPDTGELAVGTKINLEIKYNYLYGNPYSQLLA